MFWALFGAGDHDHKCYIQFATRHPFADSLIMWIACATDLLNL